MSKHNVFTNNRSNIHKGSGDKAFAAAPDVCKTPVGSAVVPIPYPNISQSSTLKKGTKSVKVNGQPAALKTSTFASSSGDQAGSIGGIMSGVTGKETEFSSFSFDVKFEGKNVVRHLDMTTHNKKNTVGAVVGSATAPVIAKKDKQYKCEWKNCKGEHDAEIEYDDDGCTVRAEYTGIWQDPWFGVISKTSSKITLAHYKKENKVKHQKTAKDLFGTNQYATENHHIIPIKAIEKLKILSHNAKLIGFDINDGRYGIKLPYFITDIFRNDLQSHKTNHRNYSKKIEKELQKLEKTCRKYCDNKCQRLLLNDLKELSDDVRQYIKNWDSAWLLRKKATQDRENSYKQAGLPHP